MIKKLFPWLFFFIMAFPISGVAQKSAIHDDPDATYRQALDLFNKEKFGAAKKLFLETVENISDPQSLVRASAKFYAGLCAAELFNPDAEKLIMDYLRVHPTHPGQNLARFHMGSLKYREREFEDAVKWFASVDRAVIGNEYRDEYLFKKGYSHFMTEQLRPARMAFAEITDPASAYFSPATYYYGHIAYLEEDYQTALTSFEKLTGDRSFGPIVPYYITHIYFLQQKYDELIAYATPLLEDATPRRAPEIAKLIGEAYFNKSEFEKALPYLETFISQSRSRVTRDDHYQIGFAYFTTNNFEEAVKHFERVTGEDDALAQNAWYHLAAAYIETGQKRFARNAFSNAYQMEHTESISRDALFNYAKLSFELSLDPYNEAILSFQKYIDLYPDSERTEDAYRHLVDLYLTTRNYKDALSSIEQIPITTTRLREAFQRVAYYRGIELFNNGNFQGAIDHFQKSRKYPESRAINAGSIYWEGEAYYRLERFDEAITAHEKFLITPGAFTLREYNRANYSIGYANFKKQNYNRAITAFRKFISDRNEEKKLINDAYLRIADSYFITKDYSASLDFYNRAINAGLIDTDYAVFQKGLVYGVKGRFENKVSSMEDLLRNHPRSSFIDDAKYELGNTWLVLDNSRQALSYFNRVIEEHPNSSYVKSAMLKTGLIHYNENEDEKALAVFKSVVDKYPGTSESQEALVTIRNIYVSLDRVDDFVEFSRDLGFADITTAQQDSLSYMAAENRYMQGDCENAVKSFTNYLDRYPDGIFALNAHFYKAECEFRSEEYRQALTGYEYVISRPKSKFTENSLMRASGITFRLGQYERAYDLYRELEEVAEFRNNLLQARIGSMRSLFRLERFAEVGEAADAVVSMERTPQEVVQEAHLLKGKSAIKTGNNEQARQALQKALDMSSNQMAAEAKYNLALIEFREGNYEKSEEIIFDFINKMAAYEYWLAKTFILLADNYLETDNEFQAKHTLQSIIENYDGEELTLVAKEKLNAIEERERMREQPIVPDTLEVDFGTEVF